MMTEGNRNLGPVFGLAQKYGGVKQLMGSQP